MGQAASICGGYGFLVATEFVSLSLIPRNTSPHTGANSYFSNILLSLNPIFRRLTIIFSCAWSEAIAEALLQRVLEIECSATPNSGLTIRNHSDGRLRKLRSQYPKAFGQRKINVHQKLFVNGGMSVKLLVSSIYAKNFSAIQLAIVCS